MFIRTYSTEDFAHILYDEENPMGYSWQGSSEKTKQEYVARVEKNSNVARRLALALELTGGNGGNGWLVNKDEQAGTNPSEVQMRALVNQMKNLSQEMFK